MSDRPHQAQPGDAENPDTESTSPAAKRWHLRWLLPLAAVTVVLAAVAAWVGMRHTDAALVGTSLEGEQAPDFTLTDQRGEVVSLSDFRGRAVVLTFIYTSCPDVCPLTAENLRVATEDLPDDLRDRVALLAVTVDPDRDTESALQAFSREHGLDRNPNWHALRGDRDTLQPIWRTYGIDPGSMLSVPMHDGASGSGAATATGDDAVSGTLGHTDAIFVIDPDGREQVLMRSALDPADLTANLRAILS